MKSRLAYVAVVAVVAVGMSSLAAPADAGSRPLHWPGTLPLQLNIRTTVGPNWAPAVAGQTSAFQQLRVNGVRLGQFPTIADGRGCDDVPLHTVRICTTYEVKTIVVEDNNDPTTAHFVEVPTFDVRTTLWRNDWNQVVKVQVMFNTAASFGAPTDPVRARAICRAFGRALGLPARPAPAPTTCMSKALYEPFDATTLDATDLAGLGARYATPDVSALPGPTVTVVDDNG